jgi:hypothetical protein
MLTVAGYNKLVSGPPFLQRITIKPLSTILERLFTAKTTAYNHIKRSCLELIDRYDQNR